MSDEQKPSDSADKAADGAFLAWVASHPTATLASGEGALLLAENDRLREQLRDTHTKVFHLEEKLTWVERERDQLTSMPAERILDKLREPSEGVLRTVFIATFGDNPVHKEACLVATQNAIRAAVTAAEQEVGRE